MEEARDLLDIEDHRLILGKVPEHVIENELLERGALEPLTDLEVIDLRIRKLREGILEMGKDVLGSFGGRSRSHEPDIDPKRRLTRLLVDGFDEFLLLRRERDGPLIRWCLFGVTTPHRINQTMSDTLGDIMHDGW